MRSYTHTPVTSEIVRPVWLGRSCTWSLDHHTLHQLCTPLQIRRKQRAETEERAEGYQRGHDAPGQMPMAQNLPAVGAPERMLFLPSVVQQICRLKSGQNQS